MSIWHVLITVVKSKRFYLWLALYVLVGLTLRAMPRQTQAMVCSVYTAWIEAPTIAKVNEFLGVKVEALPGPIVEEAAPPKEMTPDAAVSFSSEELRQMLRQFACPPSPSSEMITLALFNLEILTQIFGGAVVFALISTMLFPLGGGKENGETQAPVLWQAPRDAFRRNNRLHIGLAYAFLSCLACVLFPPTFGPKETFSIMGQMPHLMALTAGAALAAFWGTWRYFRTDAAAIVVAVQLAFSGVFASSLIALLIAMPYRIMTSVDGAALSFEQVKIFTIIRLLVLPSIAAMSAIAGIVALRWFHNVPTKWIGAAQPA